MIKLKTPEEIELMKIAGRVTAEVLDIMREVIRPGISTGELDRIAEEHIRKNNGICSYARKLVRSNMMMSNPEVIVNTPNAVIRMSITHTFVSSRDSH